MKAGEPECAESTFRLITDVVGRQFNELAPSDKAVWFRLDKKWKKRIEAALRVQRAEAEVARGLREVEDKPWDPKSLLDAVKACRRAEENTIDYGLLFVDQEVEETIDEMARMLGKLMERSQRLVNSKEQAALELGVFAAFMAGVLTNVGLGGASSGVGVLGGADDFLRGPRPYWCDNLDRPWPPLPSYMGDPARKSLRTRTGCVRSRRTSSGRDRKRASLESEVASLKRELANLESERRRLRG